MCHYNEVHARLQILAESYAVCVHPCLCVCVFLVYFFLCGDLEQGCEVIVVCRSRPN